MQLHTYPGATTFIVVGHWEAGAVGLSGCRAVLWAGWGGFRGGPPREFPPERVRRVELAGMDAAERMRAFEEFLRLDARRLPTLALGPDVAADPAFAAVAAEWGDALRDHHRARVTRQQDGFPWQRHVIANLPDYLRRPLPAAWRDAWRGRPAVVCGAGPSLDVSAPQLAARRGGCAVLAADSALRTLARHGVQADIAVSIDVAKEPGKCLPEAAWWPKQVLLSSLSPPAWREFPEGRRHFLVNRQITTDWLAAQGVPRPPVAVAESCGATALELARWLGCAPIHLMGLDLALSGGQRHTSGAEAALYRRSGFDAAQEHPTVPGNWEERVPTHALGDWRALDARLAGWRAGLVVNVTDRGARLGNTTVVRPEDWNPPASLAASELSAAPVSAPETSVIFARLRAAGETVGAAVPRARAALASAGTTGAVMELRQLLQRDEVARALGGFALKLMPHLLPPVEGGEAHWGGLLDELEELGSALRALE